MSFTRKLSLSPSLSAKKSKTSKAVHHYNNNSLRHFEIQKMMHLGEKGKVVEQVELEEEEES